MPLPITTHVGSDTEALISPHFARPHQASLHFVRDVERVVSLRHNLFTAGSQSGSGIGKP